MSSERVSSPQQTIWFHPVIDSYPANVDADILNDVNLLSSEHNDDYYRYDHHDHHGYHGYHDGPYGYGFDDEHE